MTEKNVVIFYDKHPRIKVLVDEIESVGTQAAKEVEFLRKRAEKIAIAAKEKTNAAWDLIFKEIDAGGFLETGRVARNIHWKFDEEARCLRTVKQKGMHEMIKELLDG